MVLVIALSHGKQSRDVGHLVIIDPHSPHGIRNARENPHGNLPGIFSHEFLIDFEDAAEFSVQELGGKMREIEINLVFSVYAQLHVDTYMEDFSRGDIPGYQVAVSRILFLKEIPRLAVFISPDPSALSPCRF